MSHVPDPISDPVTDKPPRPRRWIPLSLRMFLAMMLLLPIISAAWIGRRAYSRDITIKRIENLGGWVVIHPTAPDWLAQRSPAAAQLFDEAAAVYLIADRGYDNYYWHMNRFSRGFIVPESATFHATRISDADLAAICRLKGVSTLLLSGSNVTDAGVRCLGELPDLAYLSLGGSQVTDDALDTLSCLPGLVYLSLEDTHITDDGIRRLAKSPHLYYLLLDGSRVTDSGITHLADCPEIHHLSVKRTRVTESGVDNLQRAITQRNRLRLTAVGSQADPDLIFPRMFIMR